eukprot:TRINITY_DN40212_c0_g1_i6.p1 TRINITY_DN40212_c0_g1~~TRINITY_DN40212_c0_g1_i6.p1  ORF type:complete len:221 (+),score=-14.57 TRINITY_DN40212_c0_g1_i6:438-1100(+)
MVVMQGQVIVMLIRWENVCWQQILFPWIISYSQQYLALRQTFLNYMLQIILIVYFEHSKMHQYVYKCVPKITYPTIYVYIYIQWLLWEIKDTLKNITKIMGFEDALKKHNKDYWVFYFFKFCSSQTTSRRSFFNKYVCRFVCFFSPLLQRFFPSSQCFLNQGHIMYIRFYFSRFTFTRLCIALRCVEIHMFIKRQSSRFKIQFRVDLKNSTTCLNRLIWN